MNQTVPDTAEAGTPSVLAYPGDLKVGQWVDDPNVSGMTPSEVKFVGERRPDGSYILVLSDIDASGEYAASVGPVPIRLAADSSVEDARQARDRAAAAARLATASAFVDKLPAGIPFDSLKYSEASMASGLSRAELDRVAEALGLPVVVSKSANRACIKWHSGADEYDGLALSWSGRAVDDPDGEVPA